MRTPALACATLLLATACSAATSEIDDAVAGGNGNGGNGGQGSNGDPAATLDDRGAVGSAGNALLSSSWSRVTVEIDSTPDESLTGSGRDGLSGALAEHGGKDVGFAGDAEVQAQDVYSTADLRALSNRHRSISSEEGTATIHVLVLSGRHENEDTLGVAFDATSFAIFPDRIRSGLLSSVNYSTFEKAVVVHELGHLFGLVNLTGEGAFHEDADDPGHSANRESVMFWAVEDVSIGNVFRGGPPTTFDADDEREMDQIRS